MAAKEKPTRKNAPAKKAAKKKKASSAAGAPRKPAAKKAAPKKKTAAKTKVAPKKKAPPRKPPAPGAAVMESAVPTGADTVQEAPALEPPPTAPTRSQAPAKMPPRRADGTVTVAFRPNTTDAFMFYGLLCAKVDTEDRRYELVRDEIQSLNVAAQKGVYDVTAISFGAYPYVQDRYALLSCGASFGDGCGPILVACRPIRTHEVTGLAVAIPGRLTTAALALRLWLPHARLDLREYPVNTVISAVRQGRVRAGVLTHERQLMWREDSFVRVVDFGQWWGEKTEGLPLPLGANAIRCDIPEEERTKIALDVKRSIAYGLGHREEALDYATPFAKGLPREIVDRYVAMYVNELALDYAERGRQAVRQFLGEALRLGLIPDVTEPEFV